MNKTETNEKVSAPETRDVLPQGTPVMCNGYKGSIIRHYDGAMYEIRLESGSVCTDQFTVTETQAKTDKALLALRDQSGFAQPENATAPEPPQAANTPQPLPWNTPLAEGLRKTKEIERRCRKPEKLQQWLTKFGYTDLDEVANELRKRCDETTAARAHADKLATALRAIYAALNQTVQYSGGDGGDVTIIQGDCAVARKFAKDALAAWEAAQ